MPAKNGKQPTTENKDCGQQLRSRAINTASGQESEENHASKIGEETTDHQKKLLRNMRSSPRTFQNENNEKEDGSPTSNTKGTRPKVLRSSAKAVDTPAKNVESKNKRSKESDQESSTDLHPKSSTSEAEGSPGKILRSSFNKTIDTSADIVGPPDERNRKRKKVRTAKVGVSSSDAVTDESIDGSDTKTKNPKEQYPLRKSQRNSPGELKSPKKAESSPVKFHISPVKTQNSPLKLKKSPEKVQNSPVKFSISPGKGSAAEEPNQSIDLFDGAQSDVNELKMEEDAHEERYSSLLIFYSRPLLTQSTKLQNLTILHCILTL